MRIVPIYLSESKATIARSLINFGENINKKQKRARSVTPPKRFLKNKNVFVIYQWPMVETYWNLKIPSYLDISLVHLNILTIYNVHSTGHNFFCNISVFCIHKSTCMFKTPDKNCFHITYFFQHSVILKIICRYILVKQFPEAIVSGLHRLRVTDWSALFGYPVC